MAYKLIILPLAKLDIHEASIWYADKNIELEKRFIASVKEMAIIIKKNPFLFEVRYDDVRTALLKTFPYLIHFTVYSDIIVIKAIYHTSRNSKIWNSRD